MSALTCLALCWTVERADGAGLGLTSHDKDLLIGGRTYRAAPGMVPAAIERRLGLGESDGEIGGAIDSSALSEDDLAAGRWDGARVRLEAIDWEQPDEPGIALLAGQLGEVETGKGGFSAALRGAAALLERPVCPATSSECRAELGDRHCRIDLAGRSSAFAIVSADGATLTLDAAPGDDFRWGRARFVSGANSGLGSVAVAIDGTELTLRDAPHFQPVAGDRILLRHGCDKRFVTCTGRFANAANFRGEPHLPGNDLLTRYPGG
jgi:uncharacterized phage protein (TIGR02218 family)